MRGRRRVRTVVPLQELDGDGYGHGGAIVEVSLPALRPDGGTLIASHGGPACIDELDKGSTVGDVDLDAVVIDKFEEAQNRLVLQASDLSLATLASMVYGGAIDIDPEFQRRERWGAEKRSALIESFLLNIPVPPVYLAEDEFGTYSVIDGKQRLTAISEFMLNNVPLIRLERFQELEGYTFNDLPSPLQNFLKVRPAVRAVSLLRQSHPDLKYEVFHRLNSGGEPLNAQEIRNVLYRGPLNDLVIALAEEPFLQHQLKIRNTKSPNYRKMLDAEFVLRFFTLLEIWDSFSGDFRKSMDAYMEANQKPSRTFLAELSSIFRASLEVCEVLWGNDAFKRPEGNIWRDLALAGMYDAEMIAVALIGPERLLSRNRRSKDARKIVIRLFEDPDFEDSVRTATNTPSKLQYRINEMYAALSSLV